ncbi:hypothetical protein K443DRAFT_655241 [Laccaria amethystina LaAM-08-1]|uniref:Uncharacterized protein n=1 Tax=Laccaria amethystina LaAM-08-1 TaxID=1095629 RepID=A0A0C9WMM6_9AGAR|nr:hypothetical protein K443DRAFT_655241 [Laccaria amethystina LaAM-08-1]
MQVQGYRGNTYFSQTTAQVVDGETRCRKSCSGRSWRGARGEATCTTTTHGTDMALNILFNGNSLIPSRVPLSTMIAGHILGLPPDNLNTASDTPRAIPYPLYESICRPSSRVYISTKEMQMTWIDRNSWLDDIEEDMYDDYDGPDSTPSLNGEVSDPNSSSPQREKNQIPLSDASAHQVLSAWVARLNEPDLRDARCIEVKEGEVNVFDVCPSPTPSTNLINANTPLPLLALHLRRGDFITHCAHLANWNSTFTGFNSFPDMSLHTGDAFVVPRVVESSASANSEGNPEGEFTFRTGKSFSTHPTVPTMDAKRKVYYDHCIPDVGQVVRRVREVVQDYFAFVEQRERDALASEMRKEGWFRFLVWWKGGRKVRTALKEDALSGWEVVLGDREVRVGEPWAWDGIATSRDLQLGWEEKYVAQALDMYVAQRAEVFIGNGFSSLTSNVVMLRKFAGLHPIQTRFW